LPKTSPTVVGLSVPIYHTEISKSHAFNMDSYLAADIVTHRGVILDDGTRKALIQSMWPLSSENLKCCNLLTYFDYFAKQCHIFFSHKGQLIAVRTYQDITHIIADFQRGLSRNQLRESLLQHLRVHNGEPSLEIDADVLDRTIDFAARLFLMIGIGDVPHSFENGAALK